MTKIYAVGQIYKICEYEPYRKQGEKNPNVNQDTFRIMDLKNPDARNHTASVAYYGEKLNGGFGQLSSFLKTTNLQVAIVPSSKQEKVSPGLESLLGTVNKANIIYNRDFLVRSYDVPAAHEGGDRSVEKHTKSIEVRCQPNPDVPLILLDDVTTTGNSLEACRAILAKAGITNVYMVAIGHTAL